MLNSITVTIPNPTAGQMATIADLMNACEQNATKEVKSKRTKPSKTVSEEEEEDFGKKAMKKEDLDEEEEETEEEETEEEETEEEEEGLSFEEVKNALNKYGNKNPDGAKAVLLGFNIKSTKELEKHKAKWEPVYRKVMAKLKATKKAK